MHSTAQARAWPRLRYPAQAAVAARHKAGRIRLPPAKSEYLIARWMVAGFVVRTGVNDPRWALTWLVVLAETCPNRKEDPEGDRSVL